MGHVEGKLGLWRRTGGVEGWRLVGQTQLWKLLIRHRLTHAVWAPLGQFISPLRPSV